MSIAFTGSTRLEVVTVLSRTTATPESRNEALRTLLTYIESKKKRGKRSLGEVAVKLESLEETFGPFGMDIIFHQARLLAGLPPSTVPAVRDAALQAPLPAGRSSTSSGSTVTSAQQSMLPTSRSTGFLLPEFEAPPSRPLSRSETYASSSFREPRPGFQNGNSSDEWEFHGSSPDLESGSSGDEKRAIRRSGTVAPSMSRGKSDPDAVAIARLGTVDPLALAQERARKEVEEQIRALQLVLSHIGPTSPPPPGPTVSPPMPSASQFPRPPSSRPRTLSMSRQHHSPPPATPPPPVPVPVARHTSISSSLLTSPTDSLFSLASSSRATSVSSQASTAYTLSPPRKQSLAIPVRTSSASSSSSSSYPSPPPTQSSKRHAGSIFFDQDQAASKAGLGLTIPEHGTRHRPRGISTTSSSWSTLSSPSPSTEGPPGYREAADDEPSAGKEMRPDSPTLGMWEMARLG